MKRLVIALLLVVSGVSMHAEPTWVSPFYDGDTITLFKDGKEVYSYVFGEDNSKDEEMWLLYANLGSERYEICCKSWFSLQKESFQFEDFAPFVVEDDLFRVEEKRDSDGNVFTFITLKDFPDYLLRVSVSFSDLCLFA